MSGSMPGSSQAGVIDPLDSLLDLSQFESVDSFQSPSLSPETSKTPFLSRQTSVATTSQPLISSQPVMSGPSHQYDAYKQQTGIVPGALANTFAINQNNSQITGYTGFSLDYLGIGASDDMFDFNASPTQDSPDMDMDFDSPANDASFFFPETTVNPTALESSTLASPLPAQTSNVGRLWPGMHRQAALAKAQAQQRQQQQLIQQQQRQQSAQKQPAQRKGLPPSDPIVEQKITQLLNSMRAKPSTAAGPDGAPLMNVPRLKKDEEDMDEDERLLASEEGKKLSSKERRQLRNKVSARAFRSRRKEYITQLESEIANKVNECGDLKAHNRALLEENKRLSDLTRMLLSSPSFSDFLDRLSSNPNMLPSPQPSQPDQPRQESQQQRQVPKDVNPYSAQQQLNDNQQQIGMAMIPEQTVDFSVLSLDNDTFNFRPQVFTAVLETPEITIDTAALSGKASNFVPCFSEDKIEAPSVELPPFVKDTPAPVEAEAPTAASAPTNLVSDEELENDPIFALYHDLPARPETPREIDTDAMSAVERAPVFESEKAAVRFQLVSTASEEERQQAEQARASARLQRIVANLEALSQRLDTLSLDL